MGTAARKARPLRKAEGNCEGRLPAARKAFPSPGEGVAADAATDEGRSSARLWPQGGTPKNTSSPPSGRARADPRGGELWNQ